jgi:uncharacterized membrane protein YfcA
MIFEIALITVSIIASGIATLSGFGIGSLVTPLMALKVGTGIAVAGVSIAHFFGTLLRFIFWRKHVNKKVLLSFGLTSAAGGLVGALLNNILFNSVLTIVFGLLLVFAGAMGLTGLSEKLRFSGIAAWIAGAVSGFFGGLVGNQGGIRAASMLGFKLNQKEFVATATGIALMVDLARMPVYIVLQGKQLLGIWELILIATIGVFIGTIVGSWILKKIPEKLFKRVVSAIILLIGIFVLIHR